MLDRSKTEASIDETVESRRDSSAPPLKAAARVGRPLSRSMEEDRDPAWSIVDAWLVTRASETARLYRYELDRLQRKSGKSNLRGALLDGHAALARDAEIQGKGQRDRFRSIFRTAAGLLADAGYIPTADAHVVCGRLFFPGPEIDRDRILDAIDGPTSDAGFLRAIVTTGAPAIDVANLSRLRPIHWKPDWFYFESTDGDGRMWPLHPATAIREMAVLPLSRRAAPIGSVSTIRRHLNRAAKSLRLPPADLETALRRLHIDLSVEAGFDRRTALTHAEGFGIGVEPEKTTFFAVSKLVCRRFFEKLGVSGRI